MLCDGLCKEIYEIIKWEITKFELLKLYGGYMHVIQFLVQVQGKQLWLTVLWSIPCKGFYGLYKILLQLLQRKDLPNKINKDRINYVI